MSSQHYQRIVAHLRTEIDSGHLKTGDELPSEAELCEQFGSSRGPVRQAMMLLRTEGMISTGRGRRSTVLACSSDGCFDSTVSLSAWLRGFGREPGQDALQLTREPAAEDVARHLHLPAGDEVITMERRRLADGQPVALEITHLPVDIGEIVLNADDTSTYQHLADHDIIVDHLAREIRAVNADEDEARLLGVAPGTALMKVVLTASDEYGRVISHAEHLFRGADISLGLNTVRGTPSPGCLTLMS